MKNLVIIIGILWTGLVFGQKTVDISKLEKKGDLLYSSEGKKKKYSGVATKFHSNGQQELRFKVKKGMRHGPYLMWYKNGQKATERYYKKNLKTADIGWHENGQKRSEGQYKKGMLHGTLLTWHRNGQKRSEGHYNNGKMHGLFLEWYDNGQKKSEANYIDGRRDGPKKEWHANGEVKIEKKKTQVRPYKEVKVEKEDEKDEPGQIFTIVEVMPKFGRGESDLIKYLQESIRYPKAAKDQGISGIVYVTFVVDKDGQVQNVRILRGIGGGCDKEALRVVKAMPKWTPGQQRGKLISVQYNLPIRFVNK